MSFIQILLVSWKTAFRHIMISVLLWAFTALTTMPLFMLVHRFFKEYFGMTTAGTEWLKEFDMAYFLEFFRNVTVFQGVLSGLFLAMIILYYIVTLWTTGGVIGFLTGMLKPDPDNKESKLGFKEFSSHGGRLFGRYFRLSFLTFSLAGISLIPAVFGIIGMIISFLLILLWIILSDVTKTIMSVNDTPKLFRSFFQSFRFVFTFPLLLTGFYITSIIAVLAGFLLYSIIDQSFTADSVILIFLMFVIQQAWVGWRCLVRVQLFASVMTLYILKKEQQAADIVNTQPEQMIRSAEPAV